MELEGNFTNGQKYYLMLCEIHNRFIHGKTEDSCNNIEEHYIIFNVYCPSKFLISVPNLDTNIIENNAEYFENEILQYELIELRKKYEIIRDSHSSEANPIIRNYFNIISRPNYIKPEIGEYIILPTQEAIAILKTFWIRIIQRKWKKVFHQRQDVFRMRSNPRNIIIRENTGRWPSICNHMPTLNGMLYDLKAICGGRVRLAQ